MFVRHPCIAVVPYAKRVVGAVGGVLARDRLAEVRPHRARGAETRGGARFDGRGRPETPRQRREILGF